MSAKADKSGNGLDTIAWRQMFADNASAMGIPLTPLQIEQFTIYAEELIKWSRRFNITAIVAPDEIVAKHFMDSLSAADRFAQGQRVLDIGTGAGFPGLPLKLHHPSLSMTVIDGSRKKINFVSHLIRRLALQDICAIQIRSEQLRSDAAHLQVYDAIVSRALCPLSQLVEQAIQFIKPDGRILAWKGARAGEEIEDLRAAANRNKAFSGRAMRIEHKAYQLPGFSEKRSLVIVSFQTS